MFGDIFFTSGSISLEVRGLLALFYFVLLCLLFCNSVLLYFFKYCVFHQAIKTNRHFKYTFSNMIKKLSWYLGFCCCKLWGGESD